MSDLHTSVTSFAMQPGNIMVMAGDVPKIGDLGIAKLLTSTMAAKTQIGTPVSSRSVRWRVGGSAQHCPQQCPTP
jgi:hypothetical protein